jgi:hypothetical protein
MQNIKFIDEIYNKQYVKGVYLADFEFVVFIILQGVDKFLKY